MIVTVTPNPALDLTWRTGRLQPGETHRVAAGAARAGGKGLNVSRVLHQVGVSTLALTTCGGATGAEFRAELESAAVPHLLVPVTAPTRRSIAIVDETTGEATVLNEFGTLPTAEEVAALWDALAGTPASVVALSGSLPRGMNPEEVAHVVASLRTAGTATIVDTSGPALVAAADAGATVLKPNSEELHEATGHADLLDGIRDLLARGVVAVVASLGSEGLLIAHRDGRSVRARFPDVIHGNATGAGDSVTAAIAVSLDADPLLAAPDALEVLARRATAWGAAAVAMPLAGELDSDLLGRSAEVIITAQEALS